MAHHDLYDDHSLTHEELKYREHTERAAHFIKIDLFRSAREEFKAALEYRPGDEQCLSGISQMNDNIQRDKKVVFVVVPVVIAIIAAIAIFN
ncbi:MAG: hypothetical protein NTU51_09365 [Bacteroidetes bacterium]|nr:hypothetical protein [Bacteroidota bacterium]